jgi:hypothetical protein
VCRARPIVGLLTVIPVYRTAVSISIALVQVGRRWTNSHGVDSRIHRTVSM